MFEILKKIPPGHNGCFQWVLTARPMQIERKQEILNGFSLFPFPRTQQIIKSVGLLKEVKLGVR